LTLAINYKKIDVSYFHHHPQIYARLPFSSISIWTSFSSPPSSSQLSCMTRGQKTHKDTYRQLSCHGDT
jgi:hypothetical protein